MIDTELSYYRVGRLGVFFGVKLVSMFESTRILGHTMLSSLLPTSVFKWYVMHGPGGVLLGVAETQTR